MQLDGLTLFGLLSLSALLLFYALEHRSHWFVVAFAGGCIAASIYGFLQGAWPFGVVELIWAAVALKRWLALRQASPARA
jgi:presenilin-like A22 family membrane protease